MALAGSQLQPAGATPLPSRAGGAALPLARWLALAGSFAGSPSLEVSSKLLLAPCRTVPQAGEAASWACAQGAAYRHSPRPGAGPPTCALGTLWRFLSP